ncbi:sensor histidine kinase [Planococcus liqunii]|uniref:sensor histidine kinase n=1 Tax=Planococcus liqunii TaxID=3058394 RepID=UPI00262D644B|nr:sensor histidine kinase [Planococcus sp. N056]WKA51872.1 sensor histidine kinase [Planococcus sp. N056]
MRSFWGSAVLNNFLQAIRHQVFVFAGMAVIFGLIFVLGRLPLDLFLYTMELSLFLFTVFLLVQYIRYTKRYERLQELQTANSDKVEKLLESVDPADKLYIEKLAAVMREQREAETAYADRQTNQLDYFTLWLHQIKTPISAISLLNQSSSGKEARQISQELLRLEDYTHMALNYVKLEEPGSELDLSQVDLDGVIKKALKKYSILFIYNGIKLEYEPLQMTVLSDEKWLQNLLEQLISNSLKYTPNGKISIYKDSEKEGRLIIEDTGIGIRPEDLPKIFNKGYSGFNGRLYEKSTGLGLFLSRKICERLGYKLDIQSELGKGTKVLIDLSREELRVFD